MKHRTIYRVQVEIRLTETAMSLNFLLEESWPIRSRLKIKTQCMRYDKKLHAACLALAEELNMQLRATSSEPSLVYLKQTAEMTGRFVEIADKLFVKIVDLLNNQAIIIGAINYLRGQVVTDIPDCYQWFENKLATLLELSKHDGQVCFEDIPFLISLQQGILNAIQDVWNKNPITKKTNNNSQRT